MKSIFRLLRYSLVLLILTVLLSACFKKPATDDIKRLRISFNSFPNTVDPRKSADFISSTLICMIFDGLSRNLPDGSVELALAERFVMSPDQKTYTFYLRQSFWSDGSQVTAFDFERSWKQILKPGYPSLCPYLFYCIKNAENARNGRVEADQIGIKALDNVTLQVTLERPTPYFLSLTAFPSFVPTPPDVAIELDSISGSKSLISNGPFLISKIRPNAEIILKKNGGYWNCNQIKLDEIQISIIRNEMTAWELFEHGELDWIGGAISPLPSDSMNWIAKHYNIQHSPM